MVLRRGRGIQKFMCEEHFHWGMEAVNKTVTNIYFNNKQAITNDSVRKDDVVAFKSWRNQRILITRIESIKSRFLCCFCHFWL